MRPTLREIRKSVAGQRRTFIVPASELKAELRSTDGGADGEGVLTFSGHAAVFDIVTDLGYFTETVKRGAFRKALRDGQDTVFNWDHESRWPLARISAGNLVLAEDTTGLRTDSEIPLALSYAKDLKVLLDNRTITGMSYAFTVLSDSWTERTVDGVTTYHRDIEEIDTLFDVCVTVCPASPETDAEGRAIDFRTLELDEDTSERIAALNLDDIAEADEAERRKLAAEAAEAEDDAGSLGEAECRAAMERARKCVHDSLRLSLEIQVTSLH